MSEELKEQGLALFRRGEYEQALATFTEAATSFADLDDATNRGEMLNNIGVIHRFLRQWPEGIAVLTEAEQLFTQLVDPQRRGQSLGNLAMLQAASGDAPAAMQSYEAAAEQFDLDGDGIKQSDILRSLSLMQLRKGQWLPAILTMQKSASVHPKPSLGQRFIALLFGWAGRLIAGQT